MQIHIARDGQPMGPSRSKGEPSMAAGTMSLSDNAWYEGAAVGAPFQCARRSGGLTRQRGHSPAGTSNVTAAYLPRPVVHTVAGAGPTNVRHLYLRFAWLALGFLRGSCSYAMRGGFASRDAFENQENTGLQGHGGP